MICDECRSAPAIVSEYNPYGDDVNLCRECQEKLDPDAIELNAMLFGPRRVN